MPMTLYHYTSCYKKFVAVRSLQQIVDMEVDNEDEILPEVNQKTFAILAQHIVESTLDQPEMITDIADLCAKYVSCLNAEKVQVVSYHVHLLKARLHRHFGNTLTFHHPKKRNLCEFVFSSAVPAGQLLEKCALTMQAAAKATEDSEDFEDMSTGDFLESPVQQSPAMDVFRAAIFLWAEILAMRNTMAFPPTPSELPSDKIIVPDSLFNFLA